MRGRGRRRRRHIDLVRARHTGIVAEPFDSLAFDDVRGQDLRQIRLLHARIPDVLRIDDDHWAVAALVEAAGLVDADLDLLTGALHAVAQDLDESLDIALRGARLPAR